MGLLAVGTDETWVAGGFVPTPAGLTYDLATVLKEAQSGVYRTVVVPSVNEPGAVLRSREAFVTQLKYGHGIEVLSNTESGGWFTLRLGEHGPRMQLCVRDWCGNDPIVGVHRPFRDMVNALLEWQRTMIEPYRMTAGVAMISALSGSLHRQARRKLQHPATAEWWQPPANIADLRVVPKRKPGGLLHRWDMRNAYLAAAAAVDLPYRQLQHTGTEPTLGAVGYYRINIHRGPTAGLGQPDRHGCLWVAHPVYELLTGGKAWGVQLIDSYTHHASARLLRVWAERVRDQLYRTDLAPWYRATLKNGYAAALGLLSTPRGTIYRPDWRHLIIDQTRASMIRRIASVRTLMDIDPVRVDVDSIWYDTNDPEHVGRALGEGNLIGRMRYEGTGRFVHDGAKLRWVATESVVPAPGDRIAIDPAVGTVW